MNLSFVKLFSKRPASASRVPHAVSARRMLGAAALAVWALAAVPAHAQDPSPDSDDTSVTLPDPLGPATAEDQKSLPGVPLSSQIVFQVLAAEVALQRDQPAPAYQTYLALARDTHDPRMAQRATEIALAAQSPSDALAAAQLWQQYAPDSERAAQLDASLLVLSGKPDDAAPILARELARVPADNRGSAILALQLLLSRGPNRIGGLHVLQDLLKNDLNRPEAQLAIARQQLVSDDAPGARKSLEQALTLKPDYLPAALMLSQMGPEERKEGIASLEKYVQQNPKSHDARLALAQMYLASDRLDDAQKQFEIMHKNNATDLTPLMALALIKIQQKNFPEAQTYLTQYAQQAEKTPGADPGQAYIYLAQLSLEQKNEAAASDWLNKVSPASQQFVPAQITRAQLLAKQGKTEDARKLLANLQAPDPRDQALIARTDAAILFDAKRYPEAETRLQQATANFPDDPDLTYDYAMAAEKTGHYDVMEAQLRKLIQTQPDNPQAYNALGYSLADRNQRLPEADKLVERASALAPNDAFIMDSVGWVKYRMGDTSDAIKLLRKAYDLQPNAEIGAHLGEVLWKTGAQDQARAAFRDARKLEPDNDTLVKTLQRLQVNDL
ncbi:MULTISPECIES: tetratricopeptide repeat protein [Paraburkholderia]|uniref:tetratricopeptide repeat protein n=1 Tax=Paraburkholderia TaxID=1822464 RepID=UPI00211313A8|nr:MULTISPECIES: tetratricopeptide repeat protein [Paraburkholderia]MCP2085719.1 putative Zn-dependent protease [Paraburkholderia sediminicola]MCX4155549.1 tetratricopeptide repeat protein [Paraburkholderia aspalathi]MDN7164957.1 tetratricopeptide repeat protein [Paraburkholderia sp. SECH2]MDQ6393443.1 tetratricopeptide repeat protein [Paraburkholderia aspalathi]